MRNIVVFEILHEDAEPVLDWRLQGQALPMHSCPVAMVSEGWIVQWEAQEFDWQTVRALTEKQSGYTFDEPLQDEDYQRDLKQARDILDTEPDNPVNSILKTFLDMDDD